ncbi:hypothetical protein EV426DRAFT_622291, partial [Tirmania nivea]
MEARRKETPYLILLFLPAGSQWLQMADRGVEFRRKKMKVRGVFALAGLEEGKKSPTSSCCSCQRDRSGFSWL